VPSVLDDFSRLPTVFFPVPVAFERDEGAGDRTVAEPALPTATEKVCAQRP